MTKIPPYVIIVAVVVIAVVAIAFIKGRVLEPSLSVPVSAMTEERARELMDAWAEETTTPLERDDSGEQTVWEANGAFFRYDATTKQLTVSGLVRYDITLYSSYPDTWEELRTVAANEPATLGEGNFELYSKTLFDLERDVVLLSKAFTNGSLSEDQFITETRWLLSAATYWRTLRINEVMAGSLETEIAKAKENNARMLKERPRPW